jgi:hypothetical protein
MEARKSGMQKRDPEAVLKKGFDYGMELNLYISQLTDGCPVVSGT